MTNSTKSRSKNIAKNEKAFEKIRQLVKLVPYGKVATFGQIARLAGIRDVRMVGWAIRGNNNPKIPCHRLVRLTGELPLNYSLGDWQEQKMQLQSEGVNFISDTKVDLKSSGWQK